MCLLQVTSLAADSPLSVRTFSERSVQRFSSIVRADLQLLMGDFEAFEQVRAVHVRVW